MMLTIEPIKEFLQNGQYTLPENTPADPLIDITSIHESINAIKNFTETTKDFFVAVGKLIYYLTHPSLIWQGFISISYWIFLFMGLAGLITYAIGYKKGAKLSTGSIIAYTLVKAINYGLGG